MILAIDPGNKLSAYVLFECETQAICEKGKVPNLELRALLRKLDGSDAYSTLAIENIQSFGMPVGREIFDTCIWIGRFTEAANAKQIWPVYRTQIKNYFCPERSNDAGVRAAMCARYGGNAKASKQTGNLAGVTADVWSALAIASFVSDMRARGEKPPRNEAFLLRKTGFSKN